MKLLNRRLERRLTPWHSNGWLATAERDPDALTTNHRGVQLHPCIPRRHRLVHESRALLLSAQLRRCAMHDEKMHKRL